MVTLQLICTKKLLRYQESMVTHIMKYRIMQRLLVQLVGTISRTGKEWIT